MGGHNLEASPAEKYTKKKVVEPYAILEVSNGILHSNVATMVDIQFQGVSVPIGDEVALFVVGEECRLGALGKFHPRRVSRQVLLRNRGYSQYQPKGNGESS